MWVGLKFLEIVQNMFQKLLEISQNQHFSKFFPDFFGGKSFFLVLMFFTFYLCFRMFVTVLSKDV